MLEEPESVVVATSVESVRPTPRTAASASARVELVASPRISNARAKEVSAAASVRAKPSAPARASARALLTEALALTTPTSDSAIHLKVMKLTNGMKLSNAEPFILVNYKRWRLKIC